MEIYIYSLILALYPVLWFLSREEEGSGLTGMAEFLYARGRKLGQKIKGRGIFRESGIRRDLSLLYPYGRLEREERHFYVERIRIVLMIILAGDILAAAGYAAAEGRMLLGDGGLAREEIGGEDRSTQLDAYIVQESGDGTEKGEYKGTGEEGGTETDGTAGRQHMSDESSLTYQGSYRLEVRSRKYDGKQAAAMAEQVFALLPERILGENASLAHVTGSLDLPDSIDGTPFSIEWESSSYALVDSNGTVGNSGMKEGESKPVTLTAVLSYDNGAAGGLRYERDYEVIVYGPELSEEEKLSNQIKEAIRSADEQSASEERLPLPGRMGSRSIVWEEKPSGSGISVLVFAGIVSFLAAAAMGSRLHDKVVQRERQMMLDYPQIISKFVLYLGAGLSVRSTFTKLGDDYLRQREAGMAERGAYEEILLVCRELASGVPESEAYADFGLRCRARQYTKLSAILAQNLKKGNKELLSVMQQEAKASFEERRNTARKLGEEAETKLLLPMIVMLAITMLIIIIPAYYSFAA